MGIYREFREFGIFRDEFAADSPLQRGVTCEPEFSQDRSSRPISRASTGGDGDTASDLDPRGAARIRRSLTFAGALFAFLPKQGAQAAGCKMPGASAVSQAPARRAQPALVFRQIVVQV